MSRGEQGPSVATGLYFEQKGKTHVTAMVRRAWRLEREPGSTAERQRADSGPAYWVTCPSAAGSPEMANRAQLPGHHHLPGARCPGTGMRSGTGGRGCEGRVCTLPARRADCHPSPRTQRPQGDSAVGSRGVAWNPLRFLWLLSPFFPELLLT